CRCDYSRKKYVPPHHCPPLWVRRPPSCDVLLLRSSLLERLLEAPPRGEPLHFQTDRLCRASRRRHEPHLHKPFRQVVGRLVAAEEPVPELVQVDPLPFHVLAGGPQPRRAGWAQHRPGHVPPDGDPTRIE